LQHLAVDKTLRPTKNIFDGAREDSLKLRVITLINLKLGYFNYHYAPLKFMP
jgi:hypothetical protein